MHYGNNNMVIIIRRQNLIISQCAQADCDDKCWDYIEQSDIRLLEDSATLCCFIAAFLACKYIKM